ncbi:signal-transducing adaptor protein 2b [Lampris incognitus]|uniref:signal-transducing adaptor protein 2b n=1 Tax=Lampris incognitus TaxID=2546036 RepID=UPI0024B4DEDA|nr:signal-transducing adaptor protein 2b [Lampris incognitus]
MASRVGRQRAQLPHCYYEGYLEKRSFKDKTSRRLWTCLCGNTLFFFNNSKDADYIEKLELNSFISVTDDRSRDRNLDAARINLRLKNNDITLTAPSLEARELWKGFIQSVVQLSVPSKLNLLPGQIQMLKEVVNREKERVTALSPPVVTPPPANSYSLYIDLAGDMPSCYYQVSRMEAEMMLERNAKKGNMLLRPGRDGNSFAVTTRQHLNGTNHQQGSYLIWSVFRHYRVTRKHGGGFAIDLEHPIPCTTLNNVIDLLVKTTGGALVPFVMEGPYEESITFVQSDEENGEKRVQCAMLNPVSPPSVPPKTVQRECKPVPEPESKTGENLYLNDSRQERDVEDLPPPPHSRFEPNYSSVPFDHDSVFITVELAAI